MRIEIELDEGDLQKKVVAALVERMSYEARNSMEAMVKTVVLGELRETIRAAARSIISTMTFPDGRTMREYLTDRFAGKRSPGESVTKAQRLDLEGVVNEVVRSYSASWYREMIEPRMGDIKERIQKEFVDRLLRVG